MHRPSGLAVGVVCVAMVMLIGWWAWCAYVETRPEEPEPEPKVHRVTHDSLAPTYTYDGEVIRWYVLEDPDYGIQYLVNDRGGCCVRLDSYGGVVGVRYE